MTRPGTRVAVVVNTEASGGPAGVLEAAGSWERVTFDDGPEALFYRAHDESAASLQFDLSQSRRLRYPVYLEFSGHTLRRVRIPRFGRISRLDELDGGGLAVALSSNATVIVVSPSSPDAARLADVCRTSFRERRGIALIENEGEPTVLDADFATGSSLAWVRTTEAVSLTGTPEALAGVSLAKAESKFAEFAAMVCDPRLPSSQIAASDCVAFNAPAGYCQTRAEAMWRRLRADHIRAKKVWLAGNPLRFKTRNTRQCFVECYWHVAVSVTVSDHGSSVPYVIDPSSSDTLLRYADWVRRFGPRVTDEYESGANPNPYRMEGSDFHLESPGEFEAELENMRWEFAHNARPPFPCP